MLILTSEVIRLIYAVALIYMLLECRLSGVRNILYTGLCFIGIVGANSWIYLHFGAENFLRLYPLIVNLPVFIIFLFITKYRGAKVLFVFLTVIVLCAPPILLGRIAAWYLDGSETVRRLVCMAAYVPMFFIVQRYFRPLIAYMLRNTRRGWWAFCAIPFSFYGMLYVPGMYLYGSINPAQYLYISTMANLLVFSAYVIILRSFKQTREQLAMRNEQDILTMQMVALQSRSETMKQTEEITLIHRHDLRHHLHFINGYLYDRDIDSAQRYIAEIEKTITETVMVKYCSNRAVNLILSSYITMAEKENIAVQSKIHIPENCAIEDMDLCIILSNALENAIHACKEIDNLEERKIDIHCRLKDDKLYIQVTNPFLGEIRFEEDIPVAREKDHGLGTRSIAATVQKYRGIHTFTAQDGVFKMSAIL